MAVNDRAVAYLPDFGCLREAFVAFKRRDGCTRVLELLWKSSDKRRGEHVSVNGFAGQLISSKSMSRAR